MNNQANTPITEHVIFQISTPEIKDEKPRQNNTEDTQELIPRHQNKMVAEITSDMFMSGLMSE